MDRSYIDNHHIVARYLADQLSEDDRLAFEAYMRTNPEIVEDIEAAAQIKVGLHALERQGEFSSLLKQSAERRPRYLALAASLAVLAIGAFLWFGRDQFSPSILVASLSDLKDASGGTLPITSSHAVLRTRGPVYDADIVAGGSNQAVELRVLPEYEAKPARYRISLFRIADDDSLTLMGTARNLVPRQDGFVVVYFDESKVGRGRYQLRISGESDTDAANSISQFKIRLAAPAPQP